MENMPGIVRLNMIYAAITEQPHDQDDTVQLALTHRELAVLVGGVIVINGLFPELGQVGFELMTKLEEVTEAQGFLPKNIKGGWHE